MTAFRRDGALMATHYLKNSGTAKLGKLFQLKEWLTISDAARHLSSILREPVSEADVLRLGLDGHLILSVNLVNHAEAKRGRIVPVERAQVIEIPAAALKLKGRSSRKSIKWVKGIQIGGGRVLELEPTIGEIGGLYDLPMIGAESLDVEHEYQRLTGGPKITLTCLDGAFLQSDEETVFQLQEDFEDDECMAGTRANLIATKVRIASEKLSRKEADRLLRLHTKHRKGFLDRKREHRYYPAGGLPAHAVLVVRTRALRVLQERVESENGGALPEIGLRAETTYQNIIGALLKLILGHSPGGKAHSVFKNQTAVIDALLAEHERKPGISRRTLEQKFSIASRSLEAS